ncbi:hypothetical protein BTR22_12280 [Alkalihalophilus pseudofirmus]|nr:hypothetical protein BTR22_12280 [Alkalihalophilus pseudofirmus]
MGALYYILPPLIGAEGADSSGMRVTREIPQGESPRKLPGRPRKACAFSGGQQIMPGGLAHILTCRIGKISLAMPTIEVEDHYMLNAVKQTFN